MGNILKGILFCLALSFISCNTQDDYIPIDETNLVIGHWINPAYEGNKVTYSRANDLRKDQYGIAFKKQQLFVERHSGWCGTPPLIFSDFEGSWNQEGKTITIGIDNGISGWVEQEWNIIYVDDETLTLEQLQP